MATEIISYNPSTGEKLWRGTAADSHAVDAAVDAARAAQAKWANLPLEDRIACLTRYSNVLRERLDSLALALSEENGKPLWEARTEIQAMAQKVPISIEAYRDRCRTSLQTLPNQAVLHTHFRPHGVVAVLGPFNFPGHLPNGHTVPALLAGNTVIFKPSELTPRFGELMSACWEASELPFNGVFNLVQGGAETGKLLTEHPGIQGIFFTGSERTGKALSGLLAEHPEKILALEMGGNNPLIIGSIEDLQSAAYLTIQSAYITSGQRCSCARRLIVPEGPKGDLFVDTLLAMLPKIHVGFYTDQPEPFMGPVISLEACKHLLQAQQALKHKGAKILSEMRQVHPDRPLLTPGLLDVTAIPDRPDEEYFGPLLQLIRVKNLEDAFKEAANTRFGLTAGIFSDNHEEYAAFAKAIPAGVINWNTPLTGASSRGAFGGVGCSGNHRPSAYFAADYCAYPVASMESEKLRLPTQLTPGITGIIETRERAP